MRKNRHQRRLDAAQSAQKSLDAFSVYMNAERFRLADQALRSDQFMTTIGSSIAGPAMVLSAFASELYLKCLFVLETGRDPPEIHDLRKLFLLLSQTVRDEIEAAWNLYISRPNQVRVYEAIERLTGSIVPRDLRWSLRSGSDAFTSLRYLHEERNQSAKFFLGDLPGMIRDIILRKHPEWSSIVHTPPKPIP